MFKSLEQTVSGLQTSLILVAGLEALRKDHDETSNKCHTEHEELRQLEGRFEVPGHPIHMLY